MNERNTGKDMGGNGYGLIEVPRLVKPTKTLVKIADDSTTSSESHRQRHKPIRYVSCVVCSTGGITRRTYFALDGPGIESR
jgi:hypothetical protein